MLAFHNTTPQTKSDVKYPVDMGSKFKLQEAFAATETT
jgi:hypothetical protein